VGESVRDHSKKNPKTNSFIECVEVTKSFGAFVYQYPAPIPLPTLRLQAYDRKYIAGGQF
jgi:hypothetical protein